MLPWDDLREDEIRFWTPFADITDNHFAINIIDSVDDTPGMKTDRHLWRRVPGYTATLGYPNGFVVNGRDAYTQLAVVVGTLARCVIAKRL